MLVMELQLVFFSWWYQIQATRASETSTAKVKRSSMETHSTRGWTPLHLASYFGHYDTVKILLENGADLNIVNTVGDTPLHQAAHTAREQVLTVLLEYGADVMAVNSEGHQPKHLARNPNVKRLIEAAEVHESRRHEDEFLQAAAMGNMDGVSDKLQKSHVNINCTDRFGNTALHVQLCMSKYKNDGKEL
ncbi:oxysterol-binding protein-related protein 1-like [Haliotis rubra]|uniref:oxysterol-binding protein-related protein 1-like n=1 Tax=Haliotis rubra TaxID=36100 RepID=UPI001EE5663B|nr:oxysterol-binding protein-related protein 1-like [Haliotis rubra]